MSPVDDSTLERVAKQLPEAPPAPERVAAVRGALLEAADRTPQRPVRDPRPYVVAAAAAALVAVAAAALWSASPTPPPVPAGARIASVTTSGGATFEHEVSPSADVERVRLEDGAIRVDVDAPVPTRRLIVVTEDARIEVEGAAVEAVARGGRLQRVHTLGGRARIEREGRDTIVLGPGERWSREAPPAAAAAARAEAAPRPPPPPRRPPPPTGARPRRPSPPRGSPPPPPPAPEDPAELAFRDGWRALSAGDFAAAAEDFARAGARGSSVAPEARYWRAVALMRSGRAQEAEAAFARYLRQHPRGARAGEASLLLGRSLLLRGDEAGAEKWLKRAARASDPEVREHGQALLQRLSGAEEE